MSLVTLILRYEYYFNCFIIQQQKHTQTKLQRKIKKSSKMCIYPILIQRVFDDKHIAKTLFFCFISKEEREQLLVKESNLESKLIDNGNVNVNVNQTQMQTGDSGGDPSDSDELVSVSGTHTMTQTRTHDSGQDHETSSLFGFTLSPKTSAIATSGNSINDPARLSRNSRNSRNTRTSRFTRWASGVTGVGGDGISDDNCSDHSKSKSRSKSKSKKLGKHEKKMIKHSQMIDLLLTRVIMSGELHNDIFITVGRVFKLPLNNNEKYVLIDDKNVQYKTLEQCVRYILIKYLDVDSRQRSLSGKNYTDVQASTAIELWKICIDSLSIVQKGILFAYGCDVRSRKYHGIEYKQVFVGKEAVEWLIDNQFCINKEKAIEFGNYLWERGYFRHVKNEHKFKNKHYFYRFDWKLMVQNETYQVYDS